jgi:hypothetical protein
MAGRGRMASSWCLLRAIRPTPGSRRTTCRTTFRVGPSEPRTRAGRFVQSGTATPVSTRSRTGGSTSPATRQRALDNGHCPKQAAEVGDHSTWGGRRSRSRSPLFQFQGQSNSDSGIARLRQLRWEWIPSLAVRTRLRSLRLPEPMLSRPGPLPSGSGWSFELKCDGFRAIVSNERD